MLPWLILLLVLVPVVELAILLYVHHLLAAQWGGGVSLLITVGTIIVTGVLGAAFARQQGMGVVRDLRRQMGEGQLPGRSLLDGVLILIGAALLLSPGFLTDLLGFSLLIPLTRAGYRKLLLRWYRRKIETGELRTTVFHHSPSSDDGPTIIETTATRSPDES